MQEALEAMQGALAEQDTSIKQLQLRADRQTNRIVALVKQLGDLQLRLSALQALK